MTLLLTVYFIFNRSNGKLTFPLCRLCVETKQQQLCEHKDDERALSGTWVTEEVKKALEKDYKIIKIYEVSRLTLKTE